MWDRAGSLSIDPALSTMQTRRASLWSASTACTSTCGGWSTLPRDQDRGIHRHPDGIEDFADTYAAPLFPANDAFNSWMLANHPQDAAAADCCGEDGSIEEARADGELRCQYTDLWAAYLEENGCTYNDIGC